MSGPDGGNHGAAGDTARRLAGSALPPAVAEVLKTLSGTGATANPAAPGAVPPQGWRMEADGAGGFLLLEEPAGAPPRLWAALDRFGWLHALLDWKDGGLGHAWLRLPGGEGLEIHPGAGRHPLWGRSDKLCHITGRHITGTPGASRSRTVGLLPALPYHRLETLPPFDRPGDLPAGAGGAVLNLLARLLRLQGRPMAHYRGPYPTAALFASLSRCFRPALPGAGQAPSPIEEPYGAAPSNEDQSPEARLRTRFSHDGTTLAFRGEMAANPIAWEPAPFAQLLPAADVLVHLRDGVETVWIGRKAFRFRPWRNGLLAAGAGIWSETVEGAPAHGVGLAMLGRPWRRFLLLGHDGAIRQAEVPPGTLPNQPNPPNPALPPRPLAPLADLWRPVIFCWCAVDAVPALAPAILALEPTLPLQWAPLELCLAEASTEGGLLLNAAMAGRFLALQSGREATNDPGGAGDPGALATMMISDVLGELAPLVRGAAQRKLALEPQSDPGRLMEQGVRMQAGARTRLERSLPALAAALRRGEVLPPVPR